MYRILNIYALTQFHSSYLENGLVLSKTSWKNLIRVKVTDFFRNDLVRSVTISESSCRLTKIHAVIYEPYILWHLCKIFLSLHTYDHALNWDVILWKMASNMSKSGEQSFPLTEHILLYCPGTKTFRYVFWRRLLNALRCGCL